MVNLRTAAHTSVPEIETAMAAMASVVDAIETRTVLQEVLRR